MSRCYGAAGDHSAPALSQSGAKGSLVVTGAAAFTFWDVASHGRNMFHITTQDTSDTDTERKKPW